MTIRDFLSNGAEIQSNVRVRKWNEKNNTYSVDILVCDECGILINFYEDKYIDAEIRYIYVIDGCLILEINNEEE